MRSLWSMQVFPIFLKLFKFKPVWKAFVPPLARFLRCVLLQLQVVKALWTKKHNDPRLAPQTNNLQFNRQIIFFLFSLSLPCSCYQRRHVFFSFRADGRAYFKLCNWKRQQYRIPVDQNVESNKHLNKKIDFRIPQEQYNLLFLLVTPGAQLHVWMSMRGKFIKGKLLGVEVLNCTIFSSAEVRWS